MTKLIFVRHGESEANFHRIYTGQSDFPLTDRGRMQATAAAGYIKENETVSFVYASPLSRAFETGSIIADTLNVPIIKNDAFMEIFAGLWEGRKFDDLVIDFPKSYDIWRNDIGNARPDEGESVKHLYERCVAEILKIVKEHEDCTIVIATHATPIRALTGYFSGIESVNLKDVPWASNASITTVCYDKNKGFFGLVPDIREHLEGITTMLPSNV